MGEQTDLDYSWLKFPEYHYISKMIALRDEEARRLRLTELIVFHPSPVAEYNLPPDLDNMWFYRGNIHGLPIENLDPARYEPTDHFEFRDDGEWARVYYVK